VSAAVIAASWTDTRVQSNASLCHAPSRRSASDFQAELAPLFHKRLLQMVTVLI